MKRAFRLVCVALIFGSASSSTGTVSIYDIQYTTDPSGASPYAGQAVTVSGIVTGNTISGFVIAEESGPWHAVFVYTQSYAPKLGDEVEIIGTVSERYRQTEIGQLTSCIHLSAGNEIDPWVVDANSTVQEMYESVLVTINGLIVTALETGAEWLAADAGGVVRCDDANDYTYFPQIGDSLTAISGLVNQVGTRYKLQPRNTGDIESDLIPHYALAGAIVTMNPSLEVREHGYVEIRGDRIIDITSDPPTGMLLVDTGGLIFPGLVDPHNHARYNVLDLIPFGETFADRYEWQGTPIYNEFGDQFESILNYGGGNAQIGNLYRLAETRALCSGTTTMQSANCSSEYDNFFAHQGVIVNNAERFPSLVYDSVFPLSAGESFWQGMQGEYWRRFVIHLSEGVNSAALQEFYTWQSWGMLDSRTTILHGVPLRASEWELMAAADASLVWSPMSNWVLYGATADVPSALAAGVNVALGPDWTESGSRDVLAELKFACELDRTEWGGVISPEQFALFVTRNAAVAMGGEDRYGQLTPGYQADLMVIPGDAIDPYGALLAARPADVALTVVSGRPMYGDVLLIDQFPFLTDLEDVTVCGHPKKLATSIQAHAILDADKPIAMVISELREAYDQALPQVCEFLGAFDCASAFAPEIFDETAYRFCVGPNPIGGSAIFSFFVPGDRKASLRIYDASGRVLRTLVDESLVDGPHCVRWNGRNAHGRPVASGPYWARLEMGAWTETVRLLVTR